MSEFLIARLPCRRRDKRFGSNAAIRRDNPPNLGRIHLLPADADGVTRRRAAGGTKRSAAAHHGEVTTRPGKRSNSWGNPDTNSWGNPDTNSWGNSNSCSPGDKRRNRSRNSNMVGTPDTARRLPQCMSPLVACAVQRRRFPVGASPTRQPLQPETTGAVMEVTKWLKPSDSGSRYTVTARVCRP